VINLRDDNKEQPVPYQSGRRPLSPGFCSRVINYSKLFDDGLTRSNAGFALRLLLSVNFSRKNSQSKLSGVSGDGTKYRFAGLPFMTRMKKCVIFSKFNFTI